MASIVTMFVTSCHDHHSGPRLTTDSEHTLLIYITADNSLSSFAPENLTNCKEGLLNAKTPLNLVVYKDSREFNASTPSLFQLKRSTDGSRIDTIYLKRWNKDHDSCNPAIFAEVLNLTFKTFNTPIKGLEMWGHGLSWIPSEYYTGGRSAKYIGQDGVSMMDIWQMRRVLEACPYKMDYILFDACHMCTAEVGYELRHCCRWMMGAETEMEEDGFPYDQMIPALSDAETVPQAMNQAFDVLIDHYHDNGAYALFDESGFETLRTSVQRLRFMNDALLTSWMIDTEKAEEAHNQIQSFGRKYTTSHYLIYNLHDLGLMLGGDLTNEIEGVVKRHYAAQKITISGQSHKLERDCGIAISIPEFFGLTGKQKILQSNYDSLEWRMNKIQ